MIDIPSWLDACQRYHKKSTQGGKQKRIITTIPATTTKTKRPLTPDSAPLMCSAENQSTTPRHKRRKPNDTEDNDAGQGNIDPNRTPIAPLLSVQQQSDNYSTTTSGDEAVSVTTSRQSSPIKRLLQLEIAPRNPLSVVSINRRDARMPRELKTILAQLETFQHGLEVVPRYLADEIIMRRAQQRADINVDRDVEEATAYNDDDDGDFYNFRPSVFTHQDDALFWHPISLNDIMDILTATQMCTNDVHPESSWNMLVHWPVFKLALGVAGTEIPTSFSTVSEPPLSPPTITTPTTTENESKLTTVTRISCIPCTTARLTGHSRGTTMVDFCLALEPEPSTPTSTPITRESIRDLRARTHGSTVNHTDFYPLRDKPVVTSAESKKPGEGLLEAQTQVGVWQAAQWSLLERQRGEIQRRQQQQQQQEGGGCASSGERGERNKRRKGGSSIPFLPALFIQGAQWSFAATTRQGEQTLLWTQQSIGATDSVLGIFQIVRALRHIALWSATVYWPWYRGEVLGIDEASAV
ncbi:hypothetical protein F4802DRAFT_561919 [Xylaria palmicola]|nr:hypothetical protein F4802DRAFT_561919 [Xylaria palmicola]